MVEIRVKGNMSGMFADGPIVAARGLTLGDFLNLVGWDRIDHFKLNCEGMEYEILDYIIANELMPLIKTLHVQFHPILADSNARYEAIAVGLSKTHDLDFRDPWVWESWTLKP